jgi:hypothetical protein
MSYPEKFLYWSEKSRSELAPQAIYLSLEAGSENNHDMVSDPDQNSELR